MAQVRSSAALSLLAAAQLGATCVDGVTPDCSDASECGPVIVDAAAEAALAPDGSGTHTTTDAASNAEAGDAADRD